MFLGIPVSFVLAGVATVFGLIFVGAPSLNWGPLTAFGQTSNTILIAVPLFIFMGNILRYSGIAEAMFDAMYNWLGGLRGGLAAGVLAVGTIFAAMCGVSGAGTITLGLIGIPAMLKHNYDKDLALGSVAAAGLLSLLIPPSVAAILYCSVAGQSVENFMRQ